MGMYTEINIGIRFKENTPDEVIDVIKCLLGEKKWGDTFPNHNFFKCSRFRMVLTCDSYYFDSISDSKMVLDEIDGLYYLNVRSNLKNYGNEIQNFLDYICPHIETEGFIGYMRYEENEHPTLIYCNEGKIEYKVIQ